MIKPYKGHCRSSHVKKSKRKKLYKVRKFRTCRLHFPRTKRKKTMPFLGIISFGIMFSQTISDRIRLKGIDLGNQIISGFK